MLGMWKGRYSYSVDETGFSSLQAMFVLNIYEQSGRRFRGRIEGAIVSAPYKKEVSGEVSENGRNIWASTSDGVIYTGYFVTGFVIRLYSFEKKATPRIIQYHLRKISDP